MPARRTFALLFTIITCAIAVPAAAAEVGVVVVRGNAAESRRAVVGAAIETAMRGAGWSLPDKPLAKKDTDALLSCSDSNAPWACVLSSRAIAGIRHVLVVGVQNGQSATGAPMLVITGKAILAESQTVLVRQRYCEQCADDKLVAASTDLAQQIVRDLAVRSGHTVASIRSNPPGAQITLDGDGLGPTNASFGTYPGKHLLVLEKPGYITETREFTADEGKTAEVSITLRQIGGSDHKAADSSAPQLVPASLIAGGAVFLVFSGYAVYRDVHDDPKFAYTHATSAAVISGVVGLGAVGTGVYLLMRGPSNSAPLVSVTPAGAVVSWIGSF